MKRRIIEIQTRLSRRRDKMEERKKQYESPNAEIIILHGKFEDACLATGETGLPFDDKWTNDDDFGN